jgi:hypothetical protein
MARAEERTTRAQREWDGDRNDHVLHAGAKDRNHSEGHDDQRKRHDDVEHTLQHQVDQSAEIGAADAQDQAGHAAHERRGQANDQRCPGTEDDARQQVPAELVSAEPMRPARRFCHRGEIIRGWVIRGDQLGRESRDGHDDYDGHAKRTQRLALAEVQDRRPHRMADLRRGVGARGCGD